MTKAGSTDRLDGPAHRTRRAFVDHLMGMPISIHLKGIGVDSPHTRRIVDAAYEELRWGDETFSPFKENSQVCRIQRGELRVKDALAPVREVAELCEQAREVTGGAFTAWLPGQGGSMVWNPTGLVKGWAVDRAAAILSGLPLIAFSINAGGDIVAGTHAHLPAEGEFSRPWRLGVEDPRDRSRMAAIVPLRAGGLATSGTAARGAHLYDPATGAMVERAGSATVFGPELVWADVWATALFVGDEATRAAFQAWGRPRGYQSILL